MNELTMMPDQTLLDVADIRKKVTHGCDLGRQNEAMGIIETAADDDKRTKRHQTTLTRARLEGEM